MATLSMPCQTKLIWGLYYKTLTDFFSVKIYESVKFVQNNFSVGYGENIFIVQAPGWGIFVMCCHSNHRTDDGCAANVPGPDPIRNSSVEFDSTLALTSQRS